MVDRTEPKPIAAHPHRAGGVTRTIIDELLGRRFEDFPFDIIVLAKQCVLDWFAVTIAGAREPGPEALLAVLGEAGGSPDSSIVGRDMALPALSAALLNGTAAHALDYDDVSFAMSAHPNVAILPALLAAAEKRDASGRQVIASLVAGYEAGCRVGLLVAPSHYASGFHGTGTIGTFAAMAACAHLAGLTAEQTDRAFGIAATQAAGIRSMFGTDCKPLHAGKAAQNGLLAMQLAARGFGSKTGVLECPLGFAETHSRDFNLQKALAELEGGFHLRDNLFKYHAACYMTHASADAIAALARQNGFAMNDVEAVTLKIDPALDTVCNIGEPRAALEMKFSARMVAALTLLAIPTSRLDTFDAAVAARDDVQAALRKVQVELQPQPTQTRTDVELRLAGGRVVAGHHDTGVPDRDLANQGRRLADKFMALTEPVLGQGQAIRLRSSVLNLESIGNIRELMRQSLVTRSAKLAAS